MSGIEYTDASGKDLAHQILFNTEETKDIKTIGDLLNLINKKLN